MGYPPLSDPADPTAETFASSVDLTLLNLADPLTDPPRVADPNEEHPLKVGERVSGAHPKLNTYLWRGTVTQILGEGMTTSICVEWEEGKGIPKSPCWCNPSELKWISGCSSFGSATSL